MNRFHSRLPEYWHCRCSQCRTNTSFRSTIRRTHYIIIWFPPISVYGHKWLGEILFVVFSSQIILGRDISVAHDHGKNRQVYSITIVCIQLVGRVFNNVKIQKNSNNQLWLHEEVWTGKWPIPTNCIPNLVVNFPAWQSSHVSDPVAPTGFESAKDVNRRRYHDITTIKWGNQWYRTQASQIPSANTISYPRTVSLHCPRKSADISSSPSPAPLQRACITLKFATVYLILSKMSQPYTICTRPMQLPLQLGKGKLLLTKYYAQSSDITIFSMIYDRLK